MKNTEFDKLVKSFGAEYELETTSCSVNITVWAKDGCVWSEGMTACICESSHKQKGAADYVRSEAASRMIDGVEPE